MQLHGQSIKKKFARKKLNNYEYGVNMKKPLIWLLSAIIIMLGLPLIINILKVYPGMMYALILVYCVNPIYSGFLGYYTGRNIKELWILPVVPAVLFLLGAHLIYKMAFKTYIIHFFIYLLISYIAALVSVKKRKKE